MTIIAALRQDRIDAPFVLDGPVNEEWFTAFVREVVAPTLGPGDIVAMDNLGSHNLPTRSRCSIESRASNHAY